MTTVEEICTRNGYPADWADVQMDLRDGLYGDWEAIKLKAETELTGANPEYSIEEKDINYTVYGFVSHGKLIKKKINGD